MCWLKKASQTGIDNSDGMLDEARRKANREQVVVNWLKADMRDFDLGKKFSLIILPANTLCHLLSLEEFEACMHNVKRHLARPGRFVIDVFVPDIELLVNKPNERFPFGEYDDPDGCGRVVVTHSYVYEADTQIKRIKTFHVFPDGDKEIEGELNLRMYFPQELDALLRYNGFVIESKFGNFDEDAFDSKAMRQLVVCSVGE